MGTIPVIVVYNKQETNWELRAECDINKSTKCIMSWGVAVVRYNWVPIITQVGLES